MGLPIIFCFFVLLTLTQPLHGSIGFGASGMLRKAARKWSACSAATRLVPASSIASICAAPGPASFDRLNAILGHDVMHRLLEN